MAIVEFTYSAYAELINLIRDSGYSIVGYGDESTQKKCILRHDIDMSIEKALCMAELEYSLGVKSTYFVLLKTDFYNPFSARSESILRKIADMGHTIGLHFDEVAYPNGTDIPQAIKREADILSQAIGKPITVVSMHRPSKETLGADYRIDGIINSYSEEYFHNYKFLSDSRRRWRENAEDVIASGEYPNLHILTHAFWYSDEPSDIRATMAGFIRAAAPERYDMVADNFTDIESVVKKEEL